jgi:hypothetical protein
VPSQVLGARKDHATLAVAPALEGLRGGGAVAFVDAAGGGARAGRGRGGRRGRGELCVGVVVHVGGGRFEWVCHSRRAQGGKGPVPEESDLERLSNAASLTA